MLAIARKMGWDQSSMSLSSIFNPAKDRLLAGTVRLWFNQTYQRYGKMTNIQINSTAKSIHVELDLKGDPTPLMIDIKSYEVATRSGETFIQLGDIESSREWINQLICDFLPPEKRHFKLPGAVKMVL